MPDKKVRGSVKFPPFAATDYVVEYVKSKPFIESLFNNENQRKNDLEFICYIIDKELFYINLDLGGNHQQELDIEILKLLRSENNGEKAKAISDKKALDLFD
ncbi:MAG: hypothetical protein LBT56_06590 [Prevotellaceae bacterium]|nr:hypothetical protein [Prevotellaceae bacterium]